MKNKQIKVWDLPVRLFHWVLVVSFILGYLSEDDLMSLHTMAGYTVAGLVVFRLVWGVIGSRHARFSDFTYSISSIRTFLTDTLYLRAKRYIGHNPAGGAMIFLLIASLLLTSITGLAIYAAAEQAGPLTGLFTNPSEFMKEALEEIHEFFANFTLFLVFIHIAGVIVESFIHRENLA
ncbi:MAG TPA: cytochrome B, partial [Gammaproteobacteria bacterium]|nr:cytochrome B [Gammaproteobacteria bacterium]